MWSPRRRRGPGDGAPRCWSSTLAPVRRRTRSEASGGVSVSPLIHFGGDRSDLIYSCNTLLCVAAKSRTTHATLLSWGIYAPQSSRRRVGSFPFGRGHCPARDGARSEEHTSELQSLMRTSYAVFC